MGDVNSLIANPTVPDYGATMTSAIGNASALTKLRQTQDDQATMQAAGQAIANHDLQGAEDIYNRAGKVEAASVIKAHRVNIEAGQLAAKGDVAAAAKLHLENGYYDQAQKMTTDQLQQTNVIQQKIANVAGDPNITPELWNRSIDALKSAFPTQATNIEGFRDFKTGPKVALEVAGKTQEFNDNLIKQRDADLKFAVAGGVRRVEGATPGTASLNPKTMQPDQSTFAPDDPNFKTGGTAAPEDVAAAGKKDKTTGAEREVTRLKDEWEAKNPGKTMSRALAEQSYALAKQGLNVAGYKTDDNGNASEAITSTTAGTTAESRAKAQDIEQQYKLAAAKTRGKEETKNEVMVNARGGVAGAVLSHLDTVDKALNEPGINEAIGTVHGNPEYQKFRSSMFPSSVETPAAYAKLRQGLESAQAEVERLYTQTGTVTNSERDALKGIIVAIKDQPNVEVAKNLVANAKELIAGILHTATAKQVGESGIVQAARKAGLENINATVQKSLPPGAASAPAPGTPEAAQAANAPATPGGGGAAAPVTVSSPADVAKLPSGTIFVTPDGRRKVAP